MISGWTVSAGERAAPASTATADPGVVLPELGRDPLETNPGVRVGPRNLLFGDEAGNTASRPGLHSSLQALRVSDKRPDNKKYTFRDPNSGYFRATTAAAAKTHRVVIDLKCMILRSRGKTSSTAARSIKFIDQTNVRRIYEKEDRCIEGDGLAEPVRLQPSRRLRAGRSDTENRWAKLNHTRLGVVPQRSCSLLP